MITITNRTNNVDEVFGTKDVSSQMIIAGKLFHQQMYYPQLVAIGKGFGINLHHQQKVVLLKLIITIRIAIC